MSDWFSIAIVFLLAITLSFLINNSDLEAISSPPFIRQELVDSNNDRIFNIYPDKAIKEDKKEILLSLIPNFTKLSSLTAFIDMTAISYYSDGNRIYATVWLNSSTEFYDTIF